MLSELEDVEHVIGFEVDVAGVSGEDVKKCNLCDVKDARGGTATQTVTPLEANRLAGCVVNADDDGTPMLGVANRDEDGEWGCGVGVNWEGVFADIMQDGKEEGEIV